jgi:DNA-binding LytR/AlgR family response regulator
MFPFLVFPATKVLVLTHLCDPSNLFSLVMNTLPLPVSQPQVHIGGYAHVQTDEILYCQSDSNYTHVYFARKKNKMTVATTLKTIEDRLVAKGFLRVNRSELVNQEYILSYNAHLVTLVNGTVLPIARRRRREVLRILNASPITGLTQGLHYA